MRKRIHCTSIICKNLLQFADNEDLQSEWRAAKRINKLKVVSLIKEKTGYSVSPDAMFDIQVFYICILSPFSLNTL